MLKSNHINENGGNDENISDEMTSISTISPSITKPIKTLKELKSWFVRNLSAILIVMILIFVTFCFLIIYRVLSLRKSNTNENDQKSDEQIGMPSRFEIEQREQSNRLLNEHEMSQIKNHTVHV
jgi:hypothetical protein